MDIITRAEWGARPREGTATYVAPGERRYFVVHHSNGPVTQTVRAIQDWCMDGRGFADIDYNFLVRGSTGQIYEGRGWDVRGAHTVGYNTTGVGVCIIGSDQCSDAAKLAVRWLYAQYNKRCGRTLAIRGHRDLDATACPGDRNYAWVHAGMPAPANPPEDDMAFTDAEMRAFPWQYTGGGIPSGMTTLGIMNELVLAARAQKLRDEAILGAVRDDADKAEILARVDAKAAELAAQVGQVDEEVWAKVPDPDVSAAEKAALLRAVLGADAAAVGALLAQAA